MAVDSSPCTAGSHRLNHPQQGLVRIGDCTLDLAAGQLFRNATPVHLRAKSFGVLRHLALNPGRVVGKDELFHTLWAGIAVTEDTLTQSIREVRAALGTAGAAMLRTVPRRGYVLDLSVPGSEAGAAAVASAPCRDPAPCGRHTRPRRRRADRRDRRGDHPRCRPLRPSARDRPAFGLPVPPRHDRPGGGRAPAGGGLFRRGNGATHRERSAAFAGAVRDEERPAALGRDHPPVCGRSPRGAVADRPPHRQPHGPRPRARDQDAAGRPGHRQPRCLPALRGRRRAAAPVRRRRERARTQPSGRGAAPRPRLRPGACLSRHGRAGDQPLLIGLARGHAADARPYRAGHRARPRRGALPLGHGTGPDVLSAARGIGASPAPCPRAESRRPRHSGPDGLPQDHARCAGGRRRLAAARCRPESAASGMV
ncbi:MAG: winged helix-turn-helix domain-containing protein [Rhodobacteraceae bacterium]|nr:winged helix-turn-helix domain-containing protein [Paracoccaceae bacterium]